MCEICWHNPCIVGCPNYDPKPICQCGLCGEDIYFLDKVFKADNDEMYCEACFEECTKDILLEFGKLTEAEVDEYDP